MSRGVGGAFLFLNCSLGCGVARFTFAEEMDEVVREAGICGGLSFSYFKVISRVIWIGYETWVAIEMRFYIILDIYSVSLNNVK